MENMVWKSRTELLVGQENIIKLQNSNVLIVGLGGVGAYSAEMICRAGVGKMTIVDGDLINESNINRQLPATQTTIGLSKAEVVGKHLLDINPELDLTILNEFIKDEKIDELVLQNFDYVIDAIDTLTPKFQLVMACLKNNIRLVSSMGAGGKLDSSQVQVVEVEKSYNCKLAYKLRKKMHQSGYRKGFKVAFSPEVVDKSTILETEGEQYKRTTVGTISYMPAIFGCHIASIVIRDLLTAD
jgi:tRNA threonylcarbamoyladenosine dehydratase